MSICFQETSSCQISLQNKFEKSISCKQVESSIAPKVQWVTASGSIRCLAQKDFFIVTKSTNLDVVGYSMLGFDRAIVPNFTCLFLGVFEEIHPELLS